MSLSSPIVAKFGGTSMAKPELVMQRVEEHGPSIVVVSAPGLDADYSHKTTDLLLAFQHDRSHELADIIRHRLADVALRVLDQSSWRTIDTYFDDMLWRSPCPVALGEEIGARIIAAATGRTYIDACDIVSIDHAAQPDQQQTLHSMRQTLHTAGSYVIPGFYGRDPDGEIATFERGGSDITGALAARALGAMYQNWSDVDGFYTENPRTNPSASVIPTLTYQDVLHMAHNGCELLHPSAAAILSDTTIITEMASTFTGESNTLVVPAVSSINKDNKKDLV